MKASLLDYKNSKSKNNLCTLTETGHGKCINSFEKDISVIQLLFHEISDTCIR